MSYYRGMHIVAVVLFITAAMTVPVQAKWSCSWYTENSTCSDDVNCTWCSNTTTCHVAGTPCYPCSRYNNRSSCNTERSCYWCAYTSTCDTSSCASKSPCHYLDTSSSCNSNVNCYWCTSYCSSSSCNDTTCSYFTAESTCKASTFCGWCSTPVPSYTNCQNGLALIPATCSNGWSADPYGVNVVVMATSGSFAAIVVLPLVFGGLVLGSLGFLVCRMQSK